MIHFKDNEIKSMKDLKEMFKGFGFIGLGLCAVCCALPISGIVFWAGGFAVVYHYFDYAAIAALVLAIIFLGVSHFRKEKAPACDIKCKGKPDKHSLDQKKIII